MAGLDLGTSSYLNHHQQPLHLHRDDGGTACSDDGQDSLLLRWGGCGPPSTAGGTGIGAREVVARRTRGCLPGSKNKPKLPMIITRESANARRVHILEVATGCEVFKAFTAYVCVLSATRTVANVTLHQP